MSLRIVVAAIGNSDAPAIFGGQPNGKFLPFYLCFALFLHIDFSYLSKQRIPDCEKRIITSAKCEAAPEVVNTKPNRDLYI